MSKTKETKKKIVEDLREKIEKAKTITFVNYQNLETKKLNEIRKELNKENIDFQIIKNSLFKISSQKLVSDNSIRQNKDEVSGLTKEEVEKDNISSFLKGPLACAFSYEDEVLGNKILLEFSKKNKDLKILNCFLDSHFLGLEKTLELANLPSRNELLQKLVMTIQNPLSELVNVLQGNLRKLVSVLGQIK